MQEQEQLMTKRSAKWTERGASFYVEPNITSLKFEILQKPQWAVHGCVGVFGMWSEEI